MKALNVNSSIFVRATANQYITYTPRRVQRVTQVAQRECLSGQYEMQGNV